MHALRRSLLAPVVELWIFVGASLDRQDLADKVAIGARVARFWRANRVVVRRAVCLALDGRAQEASELLEKALRSFSQTRKDTVLILSQAFDRNPACIRPLLTRATETVRNNRWNIAPLPCMHRCDPQGTPLRIASRIT
jgi:hypothetical protein